MVCGFEYLSTVVVVLFAIFYESSKIGVQQPNKVTVSERALPCMRTQMRETQEVPDTHYVSGRGNAF